MTGVLIHTKHMPPSVNECFANVQGKGRIRSQRYRQWAQAAGWDMNGKGTVSGPFVVIITLDRARRHPRADADNFIKPTLDLLVTHKVIEDDRFCESVTCRWGDADGGMIVHVEPYGLNARAAA